MNLSLLLTDNVTELLGTIIEFTRIRQKLLTRNINHAHRPGFAPNDLPVEEFSSLLNEAVEEHLANLQPVLRNSRNIKFGISDRLEAKPIVDKYAEQLLEKNRDKYLEMQMNKLLENLLIIITIYILLFFSVFTVIAEQPVISSRISAID